jgi:AcrR family transcriptional regulator
MVREQGLAGIALRDLGTRVGMRAQSLYSYFASKQDIYDAMFHEGYEEFITTMEAALDDRQISHDPVAGAHRLARAYLEFCTSDSARFQLLFQRTIPGFEPSPESYALAVEAYERLRGQLALVGVHDPETLDLWTAVMTGLAGQQISNDPGGDRWTQLCDRTVDMLLADSRTHTHPQPKAKGAKR